jgi:hypothetical protein
MEMRCRLIGVSSLVIGGVLIASWGESAFAQLVPDTTLGSENSTVTPLTPAIDQIDGGATRALISSTVLRNSTLGVDAQSISQTRWG